MTTGPETEEAVVTEQIRKRARCPQEEQDLLEMCGLIPYAPGKPQRKHEAKEGSSEARYPR